MPRLIRLYIRNVFWGFALSAVFVTALMYFNVANLWHLITSSTGGWIALLMLFIFNGVVFSGVQFAIAIMSLAEDDTPKSGKRKRPEMVPDAQAIAIPVEVEESRNI